MGIARKTKILIVDDHAIVREGLAGLINRENDLEVCGEAADAPTALQMIQQAQPDMAIVDISLDGMNGLQLTKIIASKYPGVSVLVLSMHDERVYAERALHVGARGYVMKQEASRTVVKAIRRILQGDIYLSDEASDRILYRVVGKGSGGIASPEETLSDRELEVFRLVGRGLKTREIAAELNLSGKTIETYREHIKNKLNLAGAAELVQAAIAWVHAAPKE